MGDACAIHHVLVKNQEGSAFKQQPQDTGECNSSESQLARFAGTGMRDKMFGKEDGRTAWRKWNRW